MAGKILNITRDFKVTLECSAVVAFRTLGPYPRYFFHSARQTIRYKVHNGQDGIFSHLAGTDLGTGRGDTHPGDRWFGVSTLR